MGTAVRDSQSSVFGVQAHRKAVQESPADIAQFLSEALGSQKLVAMIADVSDVKTVGRWISGSQQPRSESEERLRGAYQIFQLLQSVDSPHTVRAWFIGMNPQLDDESPGRAIGEGRLREVMVAAKSYMAGG
jgi:hypothetical protein